jgi:hypothetical protein
LQNNGSAWGAPSATDGVQTAFLQRIGSISQSFNWTAGSYTVSFKAAQRSNNGVNNQGIKVFIDNSLISTITPSSTAFATYTTASFNVTAGSHTLKLEGNSTSGDNSAFIDQVTVNTGLATPTPTPTPGNGYKARFYPRDGWASRMTGGKFQGSNTSSTSGFVDLATINTTPTQSTWSELNLGSTNYRYWRYLSPNAGYGNVAEVEFYNGTTKLSGTGFGTAGSWDGVSTYTKALDSNTSTFFDASAGDGVYVGIDIGSTTPTKLTGTVIGTTGSWDGASTRDKAFDGSLSTFFDAATGNGVWAGLDLGSNKALSQVKYAPRSDFPSRMAGGKFQGSSSADFSSGVNDLYTISSTPTTGALISQSISGNYRYVRYLSPDGGWGNIAEVEFWGN